MLLKVPCLGASGLPVVTAACGAVAEILSAAEFIPQPCLTDSFLCASGSLKHSTEITHR